MSGLLSPIKLTSSGSFPGEQSPKSLTASADFLRPEAFFSRKKESSQLFYIQDCAARGDIVNLDKKVKEIVGKCLNQKHPTTGDTTLTSAIRAGHIETVDYLLRQSADPNITVQQGFTALHVALFASLKPEEARDSANYEIVNKLLEFGANATFPSSHRDCPLHILAEHPFSPAILKIFEKMLASGADVNSCNKDGETPLHIASKKNNYDMMKILLDAGADTNTVNNEGETPLMSVIQLFSSSGSASIRMLLEYGADPRAGVGIKSFDGLRESVVAEIRGKERSKTELSASSARIQSMQYARSGIKSRAVFSWGRKGSEILLEGTSPVKIYGAGGGGHSAAITDGGHVYIWGTGTYGQLGLGDMETRAKPQLLHALSSQRVVTISLGNTCCCAATESGVLYEWGDFGRGKVLTPKVVPNWKQTAIKQIAVGLYHRAVLTAGGQLYTWGMNTFGLLGQGIADEKHSVDSPVCVDSVTECFGEISACYQHMTGVSVGGNLYMWGRDPAKEDAGIQDSPKKFEFEFGKKIYSAVCGGSFTAVILDDGSLYTWGKGEYGVLGHGDVNPRELPCKVKALADKLVCKVDANFTHILALTVEGEVFSWGSKNHGNLGYDCASDQLEPKQLSIFGETAVLQIAMGRASDISLVDAESIPPEVRVAVAKSQEEQRQKEEESKSRSNSFQNSNSPNTSSSSLDPEKIAKKESKPSGLRRLFSSKQTNSKSHIDTQALVNWKPTDPVPAIFDQLLGYLETKFAKLSGIFRVNAAERDVLAVYNQFIEAGPDQRIELDERKLDGHIIAGAFKRFFLNLEEPFISYKFALKMMAISQQGSAVSDTKKIADFREVIAQMPGNSKPMFLRFAKFLADVAKNVEVNLMTPENLAICVSPCLFRSNSANAIDHLKLAANSIVMLTWLITHLGEITVNL